MTGEPTERPIASYTRHAEVWRPAIASATLLLIEIYTRWKFPPRPDAWWIEAAVLLASLLFFLIAFSIGRQRFMLFGDRVEWHRAFLPSRVLCARDIAGYRRIFDESILLIPKDKRPVIILPPDAFDCGIAWIERLPDLGRKKRDPSR